MDSNYSIKIAVGYLCDGEMDAYGENKDSRTVYWHSKCNWFQNQKLWMTCSIWSVDIFKNFLQHYTLLQKLSLRGCKGQTFSSKRKRKKNPLDICLQSYHVTFVFFQNSIIVYLCLRVKYEYVHVLIVLISFKKNNDC